MEELRSSFSELNEQLSELTNSLKHMQHEICKIIFPWQLLLTHFFIKTLGVSLVALLTNNTASIIRISDKLAIEKVVTNDVAQV